MFRTRMIVGFGAAAIVVFAVASFTVMRGDSSAGQSGSLDDGKELLPQAHISLADATAAAQAAGSGAVDEVDLEYWQGRLVFNVDVGDEDVKVDAMTGTVIAKAKDD